MHLIRKRIDNVQKHRSSSHDIKTNHLYYFLGGFPIYIDCRIYHVFVDINTCHRRRREMQQNKRAVLQSAL